MSEEESEDVRSIAPTLQSPCDVFHKLQREAWRTLHNDHEIHKADHFYNFCVTAWSLVDYLAEHLGKRKKQLKALRNHLAEEHPELCIVREIANASKHFVLKKRRVHGVAPGTTSRVDIALREHDGKRFFRKREGVPSYIVTLDDGERVELEVLIFNVMETWDHVLAAC